MIRGLMNSIAFAGFVLLLPLFDLMAWVAGSSDEKFLMKAATCEVGPFCLSMWVILIRRKGGFLLPFAVIIGGYMVIFFLIKSGMVRL